MQHDFFISYARKERLLMEAYVVAALQNNNMSYWYDDNLEMSISGDKWWKEIAKQIENSNAFIIFFTDDWQKSEICKKEFVTAAETFKKLIVPVQIDEFRISNHLSYIKSLYHICYLYEINGRAKFPERLKKIKKDIAEEIREPDEIRKTDVDQLTHKNATSVAMVPTLPDDLVNYIQTRVVPLFRQKLEKTDISIVKDSLVRDAWTSIIPYIPKDTINQLEEYDLINDQKHLTKLGLDIVKML